MKSLEQVRHQLRAGDVVITRHALVRMVERNISLAEIREAGAEATLIEDYPDDKYEPSSLMLGFTSNRRPLHFHVSRGESDRIKIITLYEPAQTEWVDYSKRR